MSNVRISKIRTGVGDIGDTKMGGKSYRKGHPLVLYSASLDIVQSFSDVLPISFGDYKPRDMFQELFFRLGAVIGSRKPKDQEIALNEIGLSMESQLEYIAGGLVTLDSFIRSTEANHDFHRLRAAVRDAECKCVAARDHIELEAKDISENLLYMLEKSMKALNIASDWVFAFTWLYSTNDDGKLTQGSKWVPWGDEVFLEMNK